MRSTVKARRYGGTASRAIDLVNASYRIDRRVETVDQKPSHAIIDQFGHRSPVAAMTGVPQASASTTDRPTAHRN